MQKKLIMDVDTGIDDALAIAYAVRSKAFHILGITTNFGNVPLEMATRNTTLVLQQLDQNIPVYPGSFHRFHAADETLNFATHVHGDDGLGNTLSVNEASPVKGDQAVDFLIEQLEQQPGEITLLFVGPLTNLAKAIEKNQAAVEKAKQIVIMGGAVTVPGNVTPYAEANIASDPKAAQVVFDSGLEITLVGLDVTLQTLLPRKSVETWLHSNNDLSQFYADITTHYVNFYEKSNPGIGGCGLHDPLAVGVILDSSFVQTKPMRLQVETTGNKKGQTSFNPSGKASVHVCFDVNQQRFLEHFLTTLNF